LAFYTVGPSTGSQALRLIDIDAADTAVGSAYGQGSASFDNTSLGSDVFALVGQWSSVYATLGQFTTDSNGNITVGLADDNELDNGIQQPGASITGTYQLVGNAEAGYGSITLAGNGDVTTLGVYMVDPVLNINDPNNSSSSNTVPGALIIDLDAGLPGGMGVITPQTDTTVADFTGSYAAGFQDFNNFTSCVDCELDMVGPFTMTAGSLSTATIGADVGDPFATITAAAESEGNLFSSTPTSVSAGYYSDGPLDGTINGASGDFASVDIYQASAVQLYWLEFDASSVFLGPIEQQGSLTGIPAVKKLAVKAQQKRPANQSNKGFGGSVR
jgi:hypothetical protein